MSLVKIEDSALSKAASIGMDEFLKVFTDAIFKAIGGELTRESMAKLNSEQITLVAYSILCSEVMDGGFVQLIHNGYGGFIFLNPFARAIRQWGIEDLPPLINKAGRLYSKYHKEIEKECSEDEFMALFEKFPMFDELDDKFVENEEEWTHKVALYVDKNIDNFAEIIK